MIDDEITQRMGERVGQAGGQIGAEPRENLTAARSTEKE